MNTTKFSWMSLVGYIALITIVTIGIVYVLNYSSKETVVNATSTPKEVVAESSPKSDNKIVDTKKMQEDVTELKIEDLVVGTGVEAVSGKLISVHYTGTLTNGTKFDSSVDRGAPFEFTLGIGEVIQGWDKGFAGMKFGGKRKLIIPSSMGYGDMGSGPIPPKATLIFEVELLKLN